MPENKLNNDEYITLHSPEKLDKNYVNDDDDNSNNSREAVA